MQQHAYTTFQKQWETITFMVLAGLCLFILFTEKAKATEILTLKQTIEVENSVVTLGDIFPNANRHRNKPLFKSPPLGHAGNISLDHLIDTAERYGFTFETPTSLKSVRVSRPARIIPIAKFETALRQQIAKQITKTNDQKIDFTYNTPLRDQMVPLSFTGTIKLQNFQFNKNRKTFRATFTPMANQLAATKAQSFTRTITGKVNLSLLRPVLTRTIKRGEKITSAHIEIKAFNPYRVPRNALSNKSDIIGHIATKNIKQGAFIQAQSLELEQVIRKNQLVTIIFNKSGMSLKTQGKAIDGGGLNDSISVMNIHSKRIIHGTIKSAGVVEISTPSPTYQKTAHLNK